MIKSNQLYQFILVVLVSLILLTAFGIIFLKDQHRLLFIHYQRLLKEKRHSEELGNKLLLEKGTWSSQTRIQAEARKQGLVVPRARDIVIVEKK